VNIKLSLIVDPVTLGFGREGAIPYPFKVSAIASLQPIRSSGGLTSPRPTRHEDDSPRLLAAYYIVWQDMLDMFKMVLSPGLVDYRAYFAIVTIYSYLQIGLAFDALGFPL